MKQALINGLYKDDRNVPDSAYLDECYDLKPTENGLVTISYPTFPVTNVIQADKMSFVRGDRTLYLIGFLANGTFNLHLINETTLASAELIMSDPVGSVVDDAALKTLVKTTVFRGASIKNVYIITDGSQYVTNAPQYSAWRAGLKADVPVPNSVCVFKDRFILGGFTHTGSFYAGAQWTEIMNTISLMTPQHTALHNWTTYGGSWLMWGLKGAGGDDKPGLLELVAITGFKWSNVGAVIIDMIRRKEMGFTPIPWNGTILAVKTLGNRIMIYGSEGIGMAAPNEEGGFDVVKLLNVGITHTNAVGGDEAHHIFVDKRGYVWKILNEYIPITLGYKALISALVSAEVNVAYDPREDDFYITGSSKSYILTPTGLGEARNRPYSLFMNGGSLYGTFASVAATRANITSHTLGFARGGFKRIKSLEVESMGLSTIRGVTKYRYTQGGTYIDGPTVQANVEGIIYQNVAGTELRVNVSGVSTTDTKVSNIRVHWQTPDSRNVRGLIEQPSENI